MLKARVCLSSLALLFLSIPCLAHGAEELGHHWDTPAYRNEMLTQIALMGLCAFAIAVSLWLAKTIKARRMGG